MRLIKENSILLCLFCSFLIACNYKPESSLLEGKWKYIKIVDKDTTYTFFTDNDILNLQSKDSTFEYHIFDRAKHKYGKWTYSDHTLHFKYSNSEVFRHFEVDIISNHDLRIHEGNLQFEFKRID